MTTLGELKAMAGGGGSSAEHFAMASPRLSRSYIHGQAEGGRERYSNQAYTMLDGTAIGDIGPSMYPQQVYPMMPPPSADYYGANGSYNSNRTIPVGLPPSPAQQYINGLSAAHPGMAGSAVPVPNFFNNTMVLPQTHSPASVIEGVRSNQALYGEFNKQPDFAGSVPPLKNAIANDVSIPMREGFHNRGWGHPYDNCGMFIRHVSSCPLCSRYMRCDNSMYAVMTIILVILFLIIAYLLIKNRSVTQ
jgi:hypothetical protein